MFYGSRAPLSKWSSCKTPWNIKGVNKPENLLKDKHLPKLQKIKHDKILYELGKLFILFKTLCLSYSCDI